MAIIKITKADILKTANVTPGWYGCQVIKVHSPAKAKDSDTINYVFDCVILPGQEKEGKEIPARFNSALIGKMAPFYYACTGKQIDPEQGVDTDEVMGKKFDGHITPNNYQGNLYDNFDNFVPYGASQDNPF
jgi:hypothetical protein